MPTSTVTDPHRRLLGQYWTPEPLADFMIGLLPCQKATDFNPKPNGYPEEPLGESGGSFWHGEQKPRLLSRGSLLKPSEQAKLLDPALGTGIFVAKYQEKLRHSFDPNNIFATELDPKIYKIFEQAGPGSRFRFPNVTNADYLLTSFDQKFDSIICNPPYTRHHRLVPVYKTEVRKKLEESLNLKISSLSSEFVYFFLKSLSELTPTGRLVYITPIELYEAAYAKPIVNLLQDRFHPRAVFRFRSDLKVFSGADNSLVVTVVDGPASTNSTFKEIEISDNQDLKKFDYKFLDELKSSDQFIHSSKFLTSKKEGWVPLSTFANVTRGIATGDNDYFLFSNDKIGNFKIPQKYFQPVITRTKAVSGLTLDQPQVRQQKSPWLLYLQPETRLTTSIQNYLKEGERQGVNEGYLVKTRRKWYHMERRDPAPILFTYLGRSNPRFIWNKCSAQALSTFLLIYFCHPELDSGSPNYPTNLKAFLWILNSSEFLSELKSHSRTYGLGGIKIEPRELMSVPIPDFSKLTLAQKKKLAEEFDRKSHS